MVTWAVSRYKSDGVFYREGACLSTDAKPTEEIGNGSALLEMDTGKVFVWDAEGTQWREL